MRAEGTWELMRFEVERLCAMERAVAEGLATLSGLATDAALGRGLQDYRQDAQIHARRLGEICERHGWRPGATGSRVLHGLQWEVRESLSGHFPCAQSDAAIVATVGKIAALTIACYEAARWYARCAGDRASTEILTRCLDETHDVADRFTRLRESCAWLLAGEAEAAPSLRR